MSKSLLRTVVSVVAIVADIVLTPIIGPVGAALVSAGIMMAGNALIGPDKPKMPKANPLDRLYATLVTTAPRKWAFGGTTALGNDLRYQTYTGSKQDTYWMVIALASHEVHSIDEIWLDNEKAWSGGSVLGRYSGYFTVTAKTLGTSSNGVAIDGTWTTSCTLTGCAYVILSFKLTGNSNNAQSPFQSGLTNRITIRGKGAKVYDPRLDSTVSGGSGSQRAGTQTTWTWDDNASRNPALQLLFYLLGWYVNGKLMVGMGLPSARIDLPSFITAANHCDESITLNGGGTEPRYRCDGVIGEDEDRQTVIESLCAQMNATLRDAGGKLSLSVIVNDLGSPVASFTEADILQGGKWSQTPPLTDCFNIVRGTRIDPSDTALYQPVDFPEVSLTSNDGIDRIDTVDYPFVQSNGQAQRLAKQRLQRNQYQGRYEFTGGERWWQGNIGDVIQLSHASYGWSSKLFRVVGQAIDPMGPCKITLLEENSAIYAWSNNEAAAVTPGTPTIYNPANDPLLQIIGAVGDGNRVRFSRMERGATGWANLYNPSSISAPVSSGTDATTGKSLAVLTATFTAASQLISLGTISSDPAYRIPVTAGERIYVGALLGLSGTGVGTYQVSVGFLNASGGFVSEPTVWTGSGGLSFPYPIGGFQIVPAGAVWAWIEYYCTSSGAGSAVLWIAEPMLCGASPNQTIPPMFNPGPSGDYGATLGATAGSGGNLTNDVTISGSGAMVGDGLQVPPVIGSGLRYFYNQNPTYSAPVAGTPATSTISLAAGTLTVGGKTVSYNAMSVGVTGTNSTTSVYNLYVDDPTYAGGTKTLVATTSNTVPYQGTGRIYMGQVSITYPASGTGSGGGGTGGGGGGLGCPWSESFVHTKRGWIRAAEVIDGDDIRVLTENRDGFEWGVVESNTPSSGRCYVIRAECGYESTVSETTPITLRDGSIIRVADIDGHELPVQIGDELIWQRCVIRDAGFLPVAHIKCHMRTYVAGDVPGEGIAHHNPKP